MYPQLYMLLILARMLYPKPSMPSLNLDLPDSDVSVEEVDFMRSEPDATKDGMVVLNPPYGERMELDDIDTMYKGIGDRLKFYWAGYKAWVISSDPTALKYIGLRPSHRYKVHNGPLECRWVGFDLYAGSKRSRR